MPRHSQDVDVEVTDGEHYSDSFYSDSSTSTSRSKEIQSRTHSTKAKSKSRNHQVVMEEMLVDVSTMDDKGTTHLWKTNQRDIHVSGRYCLHCVEPFPVASHVVGVEAVDALTAYSPNVLALHEMMKAQLELVQNFVSIQQRIYQSCMDGLQYDYPYTTFEDTKKFLHKHRNPGVTFNKEVQLVAQEEETQTTPNRVVEL